MKALTITQPWASAIALGIKHVETRSWSTYYRGPLLIHAAKGFPPYAREFAEVERALGRVPARLPVGVVVAVATLVDVRPTEEVALEVSALERLYGDYTPGRFAWMLDDVRPLAVSEFFGVKGALGLWAPDAGIVARVRAALDRAEAERVRTSLDRAGGYGAIVDELFPDEAEAERFREHVDRARGRKAMVTFGHGMYHAYSPGVRLDRARITITLRVCRRGGERLKAYPAYRPTDGDNLLRAWPERSRIENMRSTARRALATSSTEATE